MGDLSTLFTFRTLKILVFVILLLFAYDICYIVRKTLKVIILVLADHILDLIIAVVDIL